MALRDISAVGVRAAMNECDRLGREAFLGRYGFRRARTHLLVDGRRFYDSKAITAVAHRHDLGVALTYSQLQGGDASAAGALRRLGFTVIVLGLVTPSPAPSWAMPLPIRLRKAQTYSWGRAGPSLRLLGRLSLPRGWNGRAPKTAGCSSHHVSPGWTFLQLPRPMVRPRPSLRRKRPVRGPGARRRQPLRRTEHSRPISVRTRGWNRLALPRQPVLRLLQMEAGS